MLVLNYFKSVSPGRSRTSCSIMSHCTAWPGCVTRNCIHHVLFVDTSNIYHLSQYNFRVPDRDTASHPNTELDTSLFSFQSFKRCLSSIPMAWCEFLILWSRAPPIFVDLLDPAFADPAYAWVKSVEDGGILKISLNWRTCCCLGKLCCTMVARKTEKTVFQGSGTRFWAFRLPCQVLQRNSCSWHKVLQRRNGVWQVRRKPCSSLSQLV